MSTTPITYTQVDGSCPDLNIVLETFSDAFALKVKQFVCAQLGRSHHWTQEQIESIHARIGALSDDPSIAERITRLQALIHQLDLDGDGQLTELMGLQELAEQALQIATAAQSKATANGQAIRALTQQVTSFRLETSDRLRTVEGTVDSLTDTVASLQRQANNNSNAVTHNVTAIQQLSQTVAAWPKLSEADIKAIICRDVASKVRDGAAAAMTAIDAVFSDDCPLPGMSSGAGGTGETYTTVDSADAIADDPGNV